MFIGAKYKLHDERLRINSALGFNTIEIRDRAVFRKHIKDNKHESYDKIEVYDYMLYCIVDGDDTAEILEDELSSEIVSGIYKYAGIYKHGIA